jgi:hypothetical protein
MGFKADSSFLRFLTMGALGTRHVIEELKSAGFKPVELERYSTSNKIWSTKIKRLRLPDLLCVRTGMRVEVRAKSKLEIKMSHAPNNADRHWDTGLRDEDVVALVVCNDDGPPMATRGRSTYFNVDVLRRSVDAGQLSGLKAASEGSEQALSWPSVVSKRPGRVASVTAERLGVVWEGDGAPARKHSYALKGKVPYVKAGTAFPASTMILAGTPERLADLRPYQRQAYDPLQALLSAIPVDRFAAAKALPFRDDLQQQARSVVEAQLGRDSDQRVALEVANAAAALGSSAGTQYIHDVLWGEDVDAPMRMEAAFIATELGRGNQRRFATDVLAAIASETARFAANEVRQAAIWGLGHAGVRAYDRLLPFLDDPEENVAFHAIAAFGTDTPTQVVSSLVAALRGASTRKVAACSEALRLIGGEEVMRQLVAAATSTEAAERAWVIATLGCLPAAKLRCALAGTSLLAELEPLLLATSEGWLSQEDASTSLRFLSKQSL